MKVRVQGGTNAGHKAPFDSGHAPTCMCSKCKNPNAKEAER